MAEPSPPRRRANRLRLYLPVILLAIAASGWSAAWFVIRNRVLTGLDEWLLAEAASGRRWTCPDRSAGGYPFRVEIGCSSLSLQRQDATAKLGRVLAVAQIYAPGHVIVEAAGPLRAEASGATVEADWRLLQASVVASRGVFQRAAVVADGPNARVSRPDSAPFDVSAGRLELHVRPDPSEPGTADVALDAAGAVIPGLDALLGGTEPADISVVAGLTRTSDLPGRPLAAEIERWRAAGGRVDLTAASLVKGPRRLEAKGSLGLDEARRPQGTLDLSAAGVEGLLGRLVGEKSILGGNLLGALLGGSGGARPKPPSAKADPNAPVLRPLPPVRLEGGRVFIGPLALPGLRLPALY